VSIGHEIRRRTKSAVPPFIFLLLVAYFVWNATQGDRGLRAYAGRLEDLKVAQVDLARAGSGASPACVPTSSTRTRWMSALAPC
jgi:hypothetical protein